ncbi:MAG: hypothetical protein ABI639_02450 [Thermoanaerobaculia bacterium]
MELPFIDEHAMPCAEPVDATWEALLGLLRRQSSGSAWFARRLGCDPAAGTAEFAGRVGEAVPGFRVAEAERGKRLALRGRHRFADYALIFLIDGESLRARSYGSFPGLRGRLYRALVIGSGGHRLITRRMLRQSVAAARRVTLGRLEVP